MNGEIFANTKEPNCQEPSDMKGLKIRTVVADLPQVLVKALGASPTPIPWPELLLHFKRVSLRAQKMELLTL